ncbi:MAG: hypothetical protein ACRBN8_42080 [Nannocystales bacterium]
MRQAFARHLIFVLAMVMSACLMLDHLEEKSPTEDEWAHLVRGLQYWHGDDHRLQYAHPPLANAWAAAPLALDEAVPDFSTLDGWESATVGRVAYAYLQLDYDAARASLMRARRACIAFSLVGVIYAYFWGMSVLGRREGLLLAVILALHPALLGQARYVSSDVACGVACFVAVGELCRHLRGNAPGATWVGVPLGLSMAVLSKHSALLLVPVFLGVTSLHAFLGRGSYAGCSVRLRVGCWGTHALFSAFVVVLSLNLAYGFQASGLTVLEVLQRPEPQYWISSPYEGTMLERCSPLTLLPANFRLPLPYSWLFGVSSVRVQSAQGYPWASFFGAATPRGTPAFFPTLCLLKMPLVCLVGGLGAVLEGWRQRSVPRSVVIMAGAAAVFLGVAMTSRLNMGIRHVLPVLYLGAVPVAFGLGALLERARTRGRWALPVIAVVALSMPAVVHRDDYLGYFNVGRELGHQVSVVGEDVGQDRLRFAKWVEAQELGLLYYDTQTQTRSLEARWTGLRFHELNCGTFIRPGAHVALHASRRIAVSPKCFPQLVGLEPEVTFNDHIDVYRVPHQGRGRPTHAAVLSRP